MPTKDELLDENSALRTRVKELEAAAAESGDETEYENGLYVFNEGMGFSLAGVEHGVYTYDGDEANVLPAGEYNVKAGDGVAEVTSAEDAVGIRVRAEDGTFSAPEADAMYRYDGSGDLVKVDTDGSGDAGGTPVGAMNDQIVMLQSDLAVAKTQRDEARNEAARLKDELRNAGTLHGSVDTLQAPY